MKTYSIVLSLFFSVSLFAQAISTTNKKIEFDKFSLSPYGSFRFAHISDASKGSLVNNSSRVGLRAETKLLYGWIARFTGEYAVNILGTNGAGTFNISQEATTEFQDDGASGNSAFTNRLGFFELEHETIGKISVGKQWSAYYDVVGATDRFWVYGGFASGAYSLNSDGGYFGTGRADNAIIWRKSFDFGLDIGVQTQSQGRDEITTTVSGNVVSALRYDEGYGASATYKYQNFKVGIAWVQTEFDNLLPSFTGDSGDEIRSNHTALNLTYNDKVFYASLTLMNSLNGEADNDGGDADLVDAVGYEWIFRYTYAEHNMFYTGVNRENATSDYIKDYNSVNTDGYHWRTNHTYFGYARAFDSYLYGVEYKLDTSDNVDGDLDPNNEIAFHARFNF